MHLDLPIEVVGIRLRGFRQDDAEALADIEYDADIKRYLAVPHKPRAEWVRDFNSRSYGAIAVEDVARRALAGRASIDRWSYDPDKQELAIVIAKRFWGCRYGRKVAKILIKEAFDCQDCTAVVGIAHPHNMHSQALLDSFHFENQGALEQLVGEPRYCWQKGALVYELTREQYAHGNE